MAVLTLLLALLQGGASAEQVKAVFLYNFAQFVEWPADAFAEPASPLVIGILGDDPFGPFLDATVRGERVRGRPLQVRRFRSGDDIRDCHILYISRGESERLADILSRLGGRPILTVGEGPAFVRRGGVISFALLRNRVRVHINPRTAQAARLVLSSKLLQVAELTEPTRGGAR